MDFKPARTTCRTVVLLCSLLALGSFQEAYGQGYGGPSLLSRGGNRPGQRGRAPVEFTFYGAVRGTYDTGLLPVTLGTDGSITRRSVAGLQAEIGLFGGHAWRRSTLGVDYRGDWRKTNARVNTYNGSNQALAVEFDHRLNRRLMLTVAEVAGTTNRAFGGFTAPAFVEVGQPGIPLNEIFDSRIYYLQNVASVTYTQTARLSYAGSGIAFFVRRENLRLVSINGTGGGGQVSYRLNRNETISATYNYLNVDFPRVYGQSQLHIFGGRYRRQLTRNWVIRADLGYFNARTIGTQAVVLSPEVAAILGRSTGVEAFRRSDWKPRVEVAANYTLERSNFYVAVNQGVTPGNGVYLTSTQRSVRAGYSYTGIRRLSLGLSAGYSQMESLAQTVGSFDSFQGGGGLNYRLGRFFDLSAQADYRTFTTSGVQGREGAAVAVGLAFRPGRFPLSIW